jgi:DNA-binding transcriptional ArsR family regulator
MAQYSSQLDGVFQAVADPTRRAVLGRLGTGPASIGELAAPFNMALPSFMKHIRYLENTGWIRTRKTGRVRTCTLERKSFDVVETWLSDQRGIWEGRTDRLERFVATTHDKETSE